MQILPVKDIVYSERPDYLQQEYKNAEANDSFKYLESIILSLIRNITKL